MTASDPTTPTGPSQAALLGTILGAAGGASQAGLTGPEIDAEVDAAVERLDPTPPRTPAEALDLDAIEARADEAAAHTAMQGWACCEAHASSEDVTPLVAEVRRLRTELAELKWAEILTEQGCAEGRHTEWYADTENLHACPWCEIERLHAVPEADTAPAPVYQLPAEPPDTVTELWDRDGDRWERKRWPFQPDGSPAEPGTVSWMWERNGLGERQRWPGLLAYGPLTTTPPAGTETEHG